MNVTSNYVCQNCSFTSNAIALKDATLTVENPTTSFNSVSLDATGTSSVSAQGPVTVTSSHFIFNNNSFFLNNGGTLTLNTSEYGF